MTQPVGPGRKELQESLAYGRRVLARDAIAAGVDLDIVDLDPVHGWPNARLFELYVAGKFEAGREIAFMGRDEFLIDLSEFVQESLQELLVSIWPICPVHGDSMAPEISPESVPTWVCERDPRVSINIGMLKRAGARDRDSSDEERYEKYWKSKDR